MSAAARTSRLGNGRNSAADNFLPNILVCNIDSFHQT